MTREEVDTAIQTLQARIPNDQAQLQQLLGYRQRIIEEEELSNQKKEDKNESKK